MADTKHHTRAAAKPVEGDGVSYRGIVWFVGVMAATTVAAQVLMVVLFKLLDHEVRVADPPRSAIAAPADVLPAGPNLRYLKACYEGPDTCVSEDEPAHLKMFRDAEDRKLHSYEWINKDAGDVRLTIERAKALLLERGLPVRGAETLSAATAKVAK